jgi:hypothetical protein
MLSDVAKTPVGVALIAAPSAIRAAAKPAPAP